MATCPCESDTWPSREPRCCAFATLYLHTTCRAGTQQTWHLALATLWTTDKCSFACVSCVFPSNNLTPHYCQDGTFVPRRRETKYFTARRSRQTWQSFFPLVLFQIAFSVPPLFYLRMNHKSPGSERDSGLARIPFHMVAPGTQCERQERALTLWQILSVGS